MRQTDFETELKSAGYVEIETKAIEPRPANAAHAHDYDIRGLVLDGIFTVAQDNKPVTYRAGDVFFVVAGTSHTEEIGPDGAKILVGRKY
jgi:quercetin dioxygenase-like cupin family protein